MPSSKSPFIVFDIDSRRLRIVFRRQAQRIRVHRNQHPLSAMSTPVHLLRIRGTNSYRLIGSIHSFVQSSVHRLIRSYYDFHYPVHKALILSQIFLLQNNWNADATTIHRRCGNLLRLFLLTLLVFVAVPAAACLEFFHDHLPQHSKQDGRQRIPDQLDPQTSEDEGRSGFFQQHCQRLNETDRLVRTLLVRFQHPESVRHDIRHAACNKPNECAAQQFPLRSRGGRQHCFHPIVGGKVRKMPDDVGRHAAVCAIVQTNESERFHLAQQLIPPVLAGHL
mmetsp:Transcript_5870/g.17532  ORF Transcript_5870/g.17532 Transcript_5870/m.17532 type:complete len:279 (+) Transcript_5870:357-1193(+)